MARQRGKKRVFTRWSLATQLSALLGKRWQKTVSLGAVLAGGSPVTPSFLLTERGDRLITESGMLIGVEV